MILKAGTASGARVAGGAGAVDARGGRVCDTARTFPLTSPVKAYYAVARYGLHAYRRPGAAAFATFDRLNVNRVRTVFGIVGVRVRENCRPAWYRVQLPLRPNGVTGFVRASSVTVGVRRVRVLVDLSERRLTLYRNARPVLRIRVAIGSPATPTPTGRFYVNQRLRAADPTGPFGPGGIGISAFSEVLTDWMQGGPIAIHGTNRPWLIGKAVSAGCVRVRNGVLRRLWRLVPEGTPVAIRA
jgi:lipoprotein-anchoring transpeptidase ErfK/SrfK